MSIQEPNFTERRDPASSPYACWAIGMGIHCPALGWEIWNTDKALTIKGMLQKVFSPKWSTFPGVLTCTCFLPHEFRCVIGNTQELRSAGWLQQRPALMGSSLSAVEPLSSPWSLLCTADMLLLSWQRTSRRGTVKPPGFHSVPTQKCLQPCQPGSSARDDAPHWGKHLARPVGIRHSWLPPSLSPAPGADFPDWDTRDWMDYLLAVSRLLFVWRNHTGDKMLKYR